VGTDEHFSDKATTQSRVVAQERRSLLDQATILRPNNQSSAGLPPCAPCSYYAPLVIMFWLQTLLACDLLSPNGSSLGSLPSMTAPPGVMPAAAGFPPFSCMLRDFPRPQVISCLSSSVHGGWGWGGIYQTTFSRLVNIWGIFGSR